MIKCLLIPSGSFSYRFTAPGLYYYSSGYIDDANVKMLQGVVKVIPLADKSRTVSVRVGGMEAKIIPGGKCVVAVISKHSRGLIIYVI